MRASCLKSLRNIIINVVSKENEGKEIKIFYSFEESNKNQLQPVWFLIIAYILP